MERHPDPRAYGIPAPQPDPLVRHSRLHYNYGNALRQAVALPMVPAQRLVQGREERGSEEASLGRYLVRHRGNDSRVDPDLVVLLPSDIDHGCSNLDGEDGNGEEAPVGDREDFNLGGS